MSQRVNKTPRRTPSTDPSEKDFISHCRLRDVPTDGTLNGISSTDDPDTVVFIYGSKRDRRNQLIYTSFKEAVNYDTFKKYLYKHLIPCYSRRCGNGFSYIYKGNNDYTILEDDDNEKVNEEDDESIKADEEVNEIIHNEEVDEVEITHDDEAVGEASQQVPINRKRAHEEEEVHASFSGEKEAEDNLKNDEEENIPPKRQRMIEKTKFSHSQPSFLPSCPKSPAPSLNTSDSNEHLTFSTPKNSSSLSSALNASELNQQSVDRIMDAFSWLDFKHNTEEKFIKDHMFDARSADLELGALGVDPYDVPSSLISHLNRNIFSNSPALNQSRAPPILSQSIEIDEEPEKEEEIIDADESEEDITDDDEIVQSSQPKAKNSFCSII